MPNHQSHQQKTVRFAAYADHLDLSGTPPITLAHSGREELDQLIPFLLPREQMAVAYYPESDVTAYNGRIADEIHVFENLTNSTGRIPRIMLADGMVVEVTLK